MTNGEHFKRLAVAMELRGDNVILPEFKDATPFVKGFIMGAMIGQSPVAEIVANAIAIQVDAENAAKN
jgi:hypothetical protein